MTVRLPAELAQELEALARVQGMPVSEAIRIAIAHHIEECRKDDAFRDRVSASLERNQRILERLRTE